MSDYSVGCHAEDRNSKSDGSLVEISLESAQSNYLHVFEDNQFPTLGVLESILNH
jgi:hypothetical protein